MIEYHRMDTQTLLCKCMHGGPVPLADTSSALSEVSQATVEAFLTTMIAKYGSCAVLVVDGDTIVGVLWFYPELVSTRRGTGHAACIQDQYHVEAITRLHMDSMPSMEELPVKALRIECMMVVREYDLSHVTTDYTGRGIGKGMVETLITWAKAHGWHQITATAISDIKPLLLWAGSYSVERYKALGFRVKEETTDAFLGLLDAANSQKRGDHGSRIQKMWEDQYSRMSDDDISRSYSMVLDLSPPAKRARAH